MRFLAAPRWGRFDRLGAGLRLGLWCLLLWWRGPVAGAVTLREDGYHVNPGDRIQDALQAAAANRTNKVVKIHAGVYRPEAPRQALIWLNRVHDGIRIEAVGEVTLTAANPAVSDPNAPSHPAVVNHVVYFGHGISTNTVLQGVRITGANAFLTERLTRQIEPDRELPKNWFFFSDGGAVKIFGKSYPTLRGVEIVDNYTSPCGAGVSIQHLGIREGWVLFEDCIFRNNRTQVTGAALDLLEGSSARLVNCLFVGNVSNTGEDVVAKRSGEAPFTNSGAITVFQRSRLVLRRCTLTGNRNGVDDLSGEGIYEQCIFADNTLGGGLPGGKRYELYLVKGGRVQGCWIRGEIRDPLGVVKSPDNVLQAPDPLFDARYAPTAAPYEEVGYRPAAR